MSTATGASAQASMVAGDPLTQLAFAVYENKGVFAVLLGSGLSRAAEIPTGWEITLDLIRRIAVAQGVQEQTDWGAWYRHTTGHQPDYSRLLEELATSPDERRSILHHYIEPTEQDREVGRKVPTLAHHAIADLVGGGYIRVVVTTNFDRLLENALRERGIEPTVVASVDALSGAEPIAHSTCYILKLNGDYKDARIRNTESELSGYPREYDAFLDRVFDEHGLIVCGWSGDWDHALRAAFLRAPNRRYSTYWAQYGELEDSADELVKHRRARLIAIQHADAFFSELQQRVTTLEQTQRQNPVSVELLVGSAKRLLAKPEYRIQRDDLFTQESDRVLAQLDAPEFTTQGPWNQADFRARVRKYESITEPLACMAGVLGRWGEDDELRLALDLIRGLYAHAEKLSAGVVPYLNLRSYPAVLVFTAYGLGLTRAERWRTLHRLFDATIDRQYRDPVRSVELLFLEAWKGTEGSAFKQIEGLEKRKTPLSDHLFALFAEWRGLFAGLAPDWELMFERFEILASLAHLERNDKASVQQGSAGAGTWMPVGRVGWRRENAERLVAELQSEPMRTRLVQAGFAKGDPEFMDSSVQNFERVADRMQW